MTDTFKPTSPVNKPPKEQPKDEWVATNNPNVLVNTKTGMRKTKDMTPQIEIDYGF